MIDIKRFYVLLFHIIQVLATISIVDKGILPLKKKSVAIKFYVDVENGDRIGTCIIYSKVNKFCLTNSNNTEEDCDIMDIYTDTFNLVNPKDRQTLRYFIPAIYQHDLIGYCEILLFYRCPKTREKVKIHIPFDTTIWGRKRTLPLIKDYVINDKAVLCETLDQNSLNKCSPTDCEIKYNGRRPFYDVNIKRCIKTPLCLGNDDKVLPDIVYIPKNNICKDLTSPLLIQDIYSLSSGLGTVALPPDEADVVKVRLKSNCSTISQNLFFLKDLMYGRLCPCNNNGEIDYKNSCISALFSIFFCIISVCAVLFSVVCCINTTVWLHKQWLDGNIENNLKKMRTKFKRTQKYNRNSRYRQKLRNSLLREVTVNDIPLELRHSIINICNRVDKEVNKKNRYRKADIGSQISLTKNLTASTTTISSSSVTDLDKDTLEYIEKKFKCIAETYKLNSFLLSLGLMYPNPRTDGKRKIMIGFVILSIIPGLFLVCNDMRLRILNNDIANLVRQSIIMVSLIFVIIKLILTVVRSRELRSIFDEINEDYERFNYLTEDYQQLVFETIKKSKNLEKIWIIIMAVTASSYPLLAGVFTVYSMMYSDNPRRYMVHEAEIIYLTAEQKYESPYFELITFYTVSMVWVIFVGFTGFDGMFSVCVFHVSLKIKIFSLNLKNIFVNADDVGTMQLRIAKFVKDHCEINRLIGEIQKCFEIWLVGIFFNAVLQIGMALSQISSSVGLDINCVYYLFAVATVVHIYLPCYLISDVTYNAAEVANVAYSSSWEMIEDVSIRKSICFIISKAQIPIQFRALGMITFNMEMFVSILQTSYSMYTLLRT